MIPVSLERVLNNNLMLCYYDSLKIQLQRDIYQRQYSSQRIIFKHCMHTHHLYYSVGNQSIMILNFQKSYS